MGPGSYATSIYSNYSVGYHDRVLPLWVWIVCLVRTAHLYTCKCTSEPTYSVCTSSFMLYHQHKGGASLYVLEDMLVLDSLFDFPLPVAYSVRKTHFLSDCVLIRIDQSGHIWPLKNNARHWFINTSYVCIVLVQNPFPVWITFSIACGSYTGSDIVYTPGDEASLCSFLPANNS